MIKFVCLTYKELLQKFLGGRGTSAHSLNQQFFVTIFEQCNSTLGKSLMKPLLKYILPKGNADIDSEASGIEEKKANVPLQARSQHQRLLALEIFNSLVKSAQKNEELKKVLGQKDSIEVLTNVLITLVKTANSW
jgi:hypothetical protein